MDPAILDFLAHPTAVLAALDVDAAFALLQRIDEAHEGGVVAAWAKYWFARSLVLFRKEPEDAPQVAGLLAAAERDAAGTLLAERIAAPRFERERLQVGLPVPELAGEDMEGKPLALSSYRGKVVVLCFWSFDNNVARGAVPVQAQLAKRLEGRPFALVGVCSDTNKAHYANRCKVYGVTWRSFWEGRDAQLGPFATRWNVRSLPMYFVIDHEGLIQFRGADVQQIERVVAPLVEAADKAAASAGR
jgi:alkyl hydroperoxide reductase subunit AhpC